MSLWDDPWPDTRPVSGWAYGQLLAAEEGRLHYDPVQYPVHGVSNTTVQMIWGGLLADGHGELLLTDAGRARLAQERARHAQDEDEVPPATESQLSEPQPERGADLQLDLFAANEARQLSREEHEGKGQQHEDRHD
ncbi:hypothetical protein GCM10010193_69800 [Kitasatospora atroaurantiaca]|uniref:Uncharacterized protein n=1 Tax=Kitasatospora atroaurantiaca TaxID=285545 RepID=A0A561EN72_9ACTN|nr:hypothetical protein [Kitasatospora atroaurantiaca]TWE17066.1 hypothetical protein FB465_2070 [Kitasatospora atroaurantiaca]